MSVPVNRPFGRVLAALLAIASVSAPASAQDGGTFTCDASNGRFQEAEVPVSHRMKLITGRILFESRDFTGSDIPSAHIAFADSSSPPDPEHCYCKGMRAQIFPEEPNTVKYYMVRNGRAIGMAQAPLGTPITFAFRIDDNGVMTASIGRTHPQVMSAKLDNPRRDRVHVTCQSAEVHFLNLHME